MKIFTHEAPFACKHLFSFVLAGMFCAALCVSSAGQSLPNNLPLPDSSGWLSTYSTAGSIDLTNPFFQSLGTNGRSCVTCHAPTDAWTITPLDVKLRFLLTGGTEPIFRTVDGANCPGAVVSTVQARKSAYSQLLSKGLLRISIGVPDGAHYVITSVQDPYNCPETTTTQPAMYRRPLPATTAPPELRGSFGQF